MQIIRIDSDHISKCFVSVIQVVTNRKSLCFPKRIAFFILFKCYKQNFINSFFFQSSECQIYQLSAYTHTPAIR